MSEGMFRLAAFLAIFALVALAESLWPRRARTQPRVARWLTNVSLSALNIGALRAIAFLAPPLAAGGMAIFANAQGIGLFNQVSWPLWLEIGLTLLVFDFALWAQHVAFHKFTPLWRIHRAHHADDDFDLTTGLRFHPLEAVISMTYKIAITALLGAPLIAIVAYEAALNAFAMFNHSNLRLPRWLDSALRVFIVTPDMHRVHHSIERDEHDSNFGNGLSIWDRLFGLYRAEPRAGHAAMQIGLADAPNPSRLRALLGLPFSTR